MDGYAAFSPAPDGRAFVVAARGKEIGGGMDVMETFGSTLERCNALFEIFEGKDGVAGTRNDDCLRAAVVLAVAALDKFCKDKFLEHFKGYYLEHGNGMALPNDCRAYLRRNKISEKFMLKAYQKHESSDSTSAVDEISEKLKEVLYRSTFQREDSITELFQCYGLKKIIDRAVGKIGRDDVRSMVERLILRRHRIAHSADCGTESSVRPISPEEVRDWLVALQEFVESINSIVSNKFRKKEKDMKRPTAGTTPSAANATPLEDRTENEFSADFHKRRGCLVVGESPSLRRIRDIEGLFGVKAVRRGFLCRGAVDYPPMGNTEVWWPKIPFHDSEGWHNIPAYDNRHEVVGLKEYNPEKPALNDSAVKKNCSENKLRVVFAKIEGDKCVTGFCYRFLGVFKLDVDRSLEHPRACYWNRVASRIDWDGTEWKIVFDGPVADGTDK